MQAEAEAAEAHAAELMAGFPALGNPFDLYRRGFALAANREVEMQGIERNDSSYHETPVGMLRITRFSALGAGTLGNCLNLVADLEAAGLHTLALDELFIRPGDGRCDFDVVLASAAQAAELEPPSEGGFDG